MFPKSGKQVIASCASGVICIRHIRALWTRQHSAMACEGMTFSSATTFYRGHRRKTNNEMTSRRRAIFFLLCTQQHAASRPHKLSLVFSAKVTVASCSAACIQRGHPRSTIVILFSTSGAYAVTLLLMAACRGPGFACFSTVDTPFKVIRWCAVSWNLYLLSRCFIIDPSFVP